MTPGATGTLEAPVREAETSPEHRAQALDLGIGTFGPRWIAWASALGLLVLAGLYAYSRQLLHGEGVTGMGTIGAGGATWGLYIAFVVFFIGVSFAGIAVAAIIRLFQIEILKPLSRMAELLTLVSLAMGATCVIADLGQPLHGLLNLPRYARPSSPFFGTFSLVVGGYLFASAVYFFLAGRADAAACAARGGPWRLFHGTWATGCRGTPRERERHHRVSFWLSLFILPLLVTAHSTLGFIFGIQGGRPGWFNALQAPGFVVMAGISGVGVLILVAAGVRKGLHLEPVIRPEAFRWLGNFLLVLTVVYLYFMIAEELTANYAALAQESRIAHEVVFGAYAWAFWTVVVSLAAAAGILFMQFVRGGSSVAWTVAAGILVNVAAGLKRYLIVVPSQTHGMLLPYEPGVYVPTWVEVLVILGLFALGTLLYLVFVKVFPIVPLDAPAAGKAEAPVPAPRHFLRPAAFWTTLAGGTALAVAGFLLSMRMGTEPTLDPIIPFSPVLFILGVVTMFSSAVVYEVIPDGLVAGKQPPGNPG